MQKDIKLETRYMYIHYTNIALLFTDWSLLTTLSSTVRQHTDVGTSTFFKSNDGNKY